MTGKIRMTQLDDVKSAGKIQRLNSVRMNFIFFSCKWCSYMYMVNFPFLLLLTSKIFFLYVCVKEQASHPYFI